MDTEDCRGNANDRSACCANVTKSAAFILISCLSGMWSGWSTSSSRPNASSSALIAISDGCLRLQCNRARLNSKYSACMCPHSTQTIANLYRLEGRLSRILFVNVTGSDAHEAIERPARMYRGDYDPPPTALLTRVPGRAQALLVLVPLGADELLREQPDVRWSLCLFEAPRGSQAARRQQRHTCGTGKGLP